MVTQYWQVASVGGKVPKLVKVPERKHHATARCKVCVSIYITYFSVSKYTLLAQTGPHGQLASIPFLPKAFLTIASKLSVGHSHTPSFGALSDPAMSILTFLGLHDRKKERKKENTVKTINIKP